MNLVIKNYGAIKECTIDLSKKLYLFVGYNNTGKTYLTKLIYEIFNQSTLNDFSYSNYNKFEYEEKTKKVTLTEELIDGILKDYSTYLEEVVVKKVLKIGTDEFFQIEFEYNIGDIEKNELKSGARIGVIEAETEVEIYNLNKTENSLEIALDHRKVDDIFSRLPSDFFDNVPKKKFEEQINSVKESVSKTVVTSLLNLLLQNKERPFFLPSNRASILENAEELKRQEEIRKKEFFESLVDILESEREQRSISDILARKSESEYPSYMNSLIDKVIELRRSKDDNFLIKGTGFYDELLSELYQIMGGEIIYEKSVSFSSYGEKFKIGRENGEHIKMDLASSSVNQLGMLFLFLKYWAKADRNFLMIDEPEENLNPENQILLLNLLLEFVANNRLLITTHSPLIAEVINNYLVLGQLENKEEVIEELGLPDTDISPDNTGIYFFQGEIVAEHRVENYGTIFTSFKLVQDKVYNLGEKLSDLMFNQLNK